MAPDTGQDAVGGPGFTPGEPTVHGKPAELSKVTGALRATGRRVALVPTMGALHEGHRELIRGARRAADVTVVSIFVNPLQFAPGEDFDRYPRHFEADLEMCRAEGVDLVFAPTPEDLYGPDPWITVHPGPLGDQLEGASRPGHFSGVLTVVAKLLNIVRPQLALFGEKDYQQLVLVRRMAAELNIGTAIQGVPIVRAPDGLALSSRNVRLTPEQREAALALSAALVAGSRAGEPDAVLAAAREVLAGQPLVDVDYLELRDTELGRTPSSGEARLLVAARVGDVRLIDNALVVLGEEGS